MSNNFASSENELSERLKTTSLVHLEDRNGYIDNRGKVYMIDDGRKIFAKFNKTEKVRTRHIYGG